MAPGTAAKGDAAEGARSTEAPLLVARRRAVRLSPRAAVERHIAEGRDVVLEIEVQGAMKIRESFPEAVFVFILPPSYGTLHERLAGRGTETPEAMEARLRTARFELSHAAEERSGGMGLCDRQRRCGKGARTVGRDHHGGQVPHPQYEKIYR